MSSNIKARKKRDEYNRVMREKLEREKLELQTKGMLLGANWKGAYFQRTVKGVSPDGHSYHFDEYFNRAGEPITPLDALKKLTKPWREL